MIEANTLTMTKSPRQYAEVTLFSQERLGRVRYISLVLCTFLLMLNFLVIIFGNLAALGYAHAQFLVLIALLFAAFEFAFIAVFSARRLRDCDWGSWWALLALIPPINVFLVLILAAYPGSKNSNRSGLPPQPNSKTTYVLAFIVPVTLLTTLFNLVGYYELLSYTQK